MIRAMLIMLMLTCLQACVPSPLDFFKPTPAVEVGVDTEVVVGDKQEEIATGAVVGKKETKNTTNTADSIVYNTHKIDNGVSIFEIFLLMVMSFLLGWLAMPSFRQMVLMIKPSSS